MIQLDGSLLTSSSFPGAGRAMIAISSNSSPLKSPTMKVCGVNWAIRSLPKTRWKAAFTSAWVGAGRLGRGAATAAGEGCGEATGMGFSTGALSLEDLELHPDNPANTNMVTTRAEIIRKKDFMRFMRVPDGKRASPEYVRPRQIGRAHV